MVETVNSAAARRNRGFRNGIIVIGVALIVAIWAAVLVAILNERDDAVSEAKRNAANLALTFSEQIGRSLTTIEEALNFLDADLAREGPALDLAKWVQHSPTLAGFNSHISIADPTGNIYMTSVDPKTVPSYVGDREHFLVHVRGNSGTVFISKPIMSKATQRWTLQISKRIDKPDGSFGGVIVLSLDTDYFIRLYEPADLGASGTVGVIGLDGILRARLGASVDPDNSGVGNSAVGSPLFGRISINENGVDIFPSWVDHIQRIFAYRRIQGYPLAVIVGIGLHGVLAHPIAVAVRILIVTAVATLVLAALLAYLVIEINRRSRNEQELAAERTKLEAINRDLEINRNAAEAANRAKSEFLANMSHELRTPLNAVIGFAGIMKDEIMGPLGTPSYREYAQHIHDSGNHLLDEINNILDLSKAEAGVIELREEEVDLPGTIKARAASIRSAAEAAGVELSTDLADAPAALRSDEVRLRQIIDNLLSNGVKFTPRGGQVVVRARLTLDGRPTVEVEDTGIGIASQDIARVLEPFRQADSSLHRKFGGTGLGLSIVKHLVELHGGTLHIDSEPGKGTIVTAIFPKERLVGRAAAFAGSLRA